MSPGSAPNNSSRSTPFPLKPHAVMIPPNNARHGGTVRMLRSYNSLGMFAMLARSRSGCGGWHWSSPREWFSRTSSRQLLETALNDQRPDERRKAVNEMAARSDASADWAVKAFDTIARTDKDPMVRVEAVR